MALYLGLTAVLIARGYFGIPRLPVPYPYRDPYPIVLTITPTLARHKAAGPKGGPAPVRLRLSDRAQDLYLSLDCRVRPADWNSRTGRVRKTYPLADELNELIETRVQDAERARVKLLTAGAVPTARAVKDALTGTVEAGDFLSFARAFLVRVEAGGNVQRARAERAVLDKLASFAGDPLPFRAITLDLLERWAEWLRAEKGNKASTVARSITVARLHWRRAVVHGVVEGNPFELYRGPRIDTAERTKLTARQLEALSSVDLPDGFGRASVRAWFLFAVYAGGVRFSDVMQLRRRDVHRIDGGDWRLTYRQSKTGKVVDALLTAPALAVLRPYLDAPGASDDWLFSDGLGPYNVDTPAALNAALSSRNAYANKVLRELAGLAGIEGKVSFHVARHTFADLARRAGWNVHDVSRAMAHSTLAVTDRYLATMDRERLDGGMRTLFEPAPGTLTPAGTGAGAHADADSGRW